MSSAATPIPSNGFHSSQVALGASVISAAGALQAGHRQLRFVRDDGTNLPPTGSRNPAPPLIRRAGAPVAASNEDIAADLLEIQEAPPATPVPSPMRQEVVQSATAPVSPVFQAVSPSTEAVPAVVPPTLSDEVVFVSDVFDLAVPCFDVVPQPDVGMLSLVVPTSVKLKLAPGQQVNMRHKGRERLYWFTGLAVPVTIVSAQVLVFSDCTPQ